MEYVFVAVIAAIVGFFIGLSRNYKDEPDVINLPVVVGIEKINNRTLRISIARNGEIHEIDSYLTYGVNVAKLQKEIIG
jgi:hypothetical protein